MTDEFNRITNHDFIRAGDGRCGFAWGSGPDRERCGNTQERHAQVIDDSLTSHESTKRVLFHVVNAYQKWRATKFLPNELTDDAVRVGEQHLRLVDWFPENEGWLPNGTDQTPNDGAPVIILKNNVLTLIDEELARLRYTHPGDGGKRWRRGVRDARAVAAEKLQAIRDAYVAEAIVRESEALRLYDISEDQIDAW